MLVDVSCEMDTLKKKKKKTLFIVLVLFHYHIILCLFCVVTKTENKAYSDSIGTFK